MNMRSRRDFIKTTAVAGAGLTFLNSNPLFAKDKESKLRLGFIGVGLRGQNHLELALRRNDVEVLALCDVQQVMMDSAMDLVNKSGKPKPQLILEGPYGYKKLLENKDIDAVIIDSLGMAHRHVFGCNECKEVRRLRSNHRHDS